MLFSVFSFLPFYLPSIWRFYFGVHTYVSFWLKFDVGGILGV